ncbi:MAG: hypothetical protein E2O29_02125 [Deltaproteobacteria bacterium]|nr:MAG: hypothetical protein E2O29_02125 [Deltaproteobacteria bacterium]
MWPLTCVTVIFVIRQMIFMYSDYFHPRERKKLPGELMEIADKIASKKPAITKEEIHDLLIDMYLAEKEIKKNKDKKIKSRKYFKRDDKKKIKKRYKKESCAIR